MGRKVKVNESQRLRYEPTTEDDAELMFQLDQDPEVMRYISHGKVSTMEQIISEYMPRLAKYADAERGWGLWKAITKQDDEFIGWILVRPMGFFDGNRDDDNLELGWRFFRSAWGHGYATEAATAVMSALEGVGYRRFTAMAIEENTASVNVMKKLGMQYVKTSTHPDAHENDRVVYYERTVPPDPSQA